MYNHTTQVGRVASDVDMRYSPSGVAIAKFRLAVDREFKKGETKETDFHNIVCFQKQAETVAQYLKKGRLVVVDGKVQNRNWDGDDGKRHYMTEIIANPFGIRFMPDGKGHGGNDDTAHGDDRQQEEVPW